MTPPIRAFFDANVFICFLLRPTASSPPAAIVRAGFAGAFTLLVSQTVVAELTRKVAAKPYLSARIAAADVAAFTGLLAEAAEIVPEIPEPFPAVGRDRKDDYLFAHALIARADYLVSGDADLRAVGRIDGVGIANPAEFFQLLQRVAAVR
jgi:putative PIN family toxin of toxin-antitoxin system